MNDILVGKGDPGSAAGAGVDVSLLARLGNRHGLKVAEVIGQFGTGEAMIKSAARTVGSQLGRQLLRGVLGSLTRR